MAHEERNAWAALIASIFVFVYFGGHIWSTTAGGGYAGTAGLSLWAWDVIWFILGGIAAVIVSVIAFNVLYAIITRSPNPGFLTDERDMAITRTGTLITLGITSAGFIGAVILLAMGWGAIAGFNTILIGMALGAFASDIYRVAVYRLGL